VDRAQKAALSSVAVGLTVFALKFWAYWVTGSVALYSDALESTINVVAAGAAFLALRISAQPADANHPYGHHKAEYFSAVFEGVLIVLAALSILREAYQGFLAPRPMEAPVLGLGINAAATLINGAWAWALLRWGRAWRSPALVADAHHVLTDVWTSVGVLAGLGLVGLTGWLVLDPALATLVALNILWSGWRTIREATGGLMDEAPPAEEIHRVKTIISEHATGAIEAHDVRIRHAGRMTFVDFHLIVAGDMRVADAHDICDRIEAALREALASGAIITIHVEPENKAKHSGVLVL
jgi:cation diffusion facilitator family transporter